jgi:hypothetical protein
MSDAKRKAAIERIAANIGPVLADDPVNLPDHYARYKIEPIRFGVENFGRGVLITKIVKYIMRAPFKGKPVEDLEKAQRCLDMLKKLDAGDPDWWKHPAGEKPVAS